jgi:hypothetical protein
MPSLSSRSVNLPSHIKVPPQPVGVRAEIPTPPPTYVGRHPFMLSSLPGIATTDDSAMRQFFGGRIAPMRRVARTS